MNVKEKFLELTSRTYPHGTEDEVISLLDPKLKEDGYGNLFIKIGESDVMFTSHLDTATSAHDVVKHVIEDNIIKTDGTSILGADDKAGVTIMLYMIENNVPGLYYFFLGEEVGCLGSRDLSKKYKELNLGINKVVAFDRKDNTSVITHKGYRRGCSDKFAEALRDQLNNADVTFKYKLDDTGGSTDSFQFIEQIPECTNLSVGYKSEHTFRESQDIEHLEKLAIACTKVDWNSLPVERDPSKYDYKKTTYNSSSSYNNSYGYGGWRWRSDDYYDTYNSSKSYVKPNEGFSNDKSQLLLPAGRTSKVYFHDKKYNYISTIETDLLTNKIIQVDLFSDRIVQEKMIIEDLLKALELEFMRLTWDGMNLTVYYSEGHMTSTTRNELIEYLPELDYINDYDISMDSDTYVDSAFTEKIEYN